MSSTVLTNLSRKFATRRALSTALVVSLSTLLTAFAATARGQGNGDANMREIAPFIGYAETFQWGSIPEVAEGLAKENIQDNTWAEDLFFQREVWQLSFKYKNIRAIQVDLPTKNGIVTKRVWYLVYSVTNTGKRLRAVLDEESNAVFKDSLDKTIAEGAGLKAKVDNVAISHRVVEGGDAADLAFEHPSNNLKGVYKGEEVVYDGSEKDEDGNPLGAVTFVPRFIFASATIQDRLVYERKGDFFVGHKKGAQEAFYFDEYLPIAFEKILEQESRPGMTFYSTPEISKKQILPGETVWGIATWTDVDPRINKFSVYISGLTNSMRWDISEDAEISDEVVGAGRDIQRKVLKINFFNPGDEAHRGGKEIYNNLPGELDYQWIYL